MGPSGGGKTTLAEALATELAVPLMSVRYEGLICAAGPGQRPARYRRVASASEHTLSATDVRLLLRPSLRSSATGVVTHLRLGRAGLTRLAWRAGATFVHDGFALAIGLLVLGHVYFAMKDREARRGMRTGQVSRAWARDEHAEWVDEIDSSR